MHYLVISHPHADHISDIRNMLDLKMDPKVLNRPRDIDRDLIISSNQKKYSDIVKLYLELDGRYNGPVPEGFSSIKPLKLRLDPNKLLSPK